jgi:hypothetical protein
LRPKTTTYPQPILLNNTENWAVALGGGLGQIPAKKVMDFFLIDPVGLLKGKLSILLSIGFLIRFGILMLIVFNVFS